MDKIDSKYHVGDTVVIVEVANCAFGQNCYMKELIGMKRTIRKVFWDHDRETYGYFIENDKDGCWTWDDSCFEMCSTAFPQDLPEFDASGANVLDLFS